VKALAKIAEDGDKNALLIFKIFTYNLCFFLKDFINTEKADAVVIGGNITTVSRLFFKTLIWEMAGYFEDVNIKIARLDDDSALIGAAAAFDINQRQNVPMYV
jgi:glucokinase